jgi:hypothetical protein
MQPRGDLRRAPRMIQLQQPAQHLPPRRLADRVAEALRGFVEARPQVEIAAAYGCSDGVVHHHVQQAGLAARRQRAQDVVPAHVGFVDDFVRDEQV